MKNLVSLFFLLCLLLSSCSNITMVRTKEIKEASENSAAIINKRLDSLSLVIDSMKNEQERMSSRLRADFVEFNSKISEQGNKSEARMEEINFRLDRILTTVQQKSTVTRSAAGNKQAPKEDNSEMIALYNASRSDYLKGEYVVAYNGFKQIYETVKTGELAENSLYWMGMCMLDANRKDNAVTLFKTLLDRFPQSTKVCTVIFKLASMAEESGNSEEQKAYLKKLISTEHCAPSNEFHRAATILSS
ncbi:MAG: tetratricopeptide repeat protein [Fibromonadaceae bacterium]|jgi:TolA-binding protein|nr:tetratricopeptide repeat protein [Fibromonadaceae bacterium]